MQRTYRYIVFSSLAFLVLMTACPNGTREEESLRDTAEQPAAPAVPDVPVRPSGEIVEPADGDIFTTGEDVEILLSFYQDAAEVESVRLTADGEEVGFSGSIPGNLVWNTSGQPVGSRQVRVEVFFDDGRTESYRLSIQFKSDIVPRQYSYRVVNDYPHDIRSFTQGLAYHDGYLYESTGQYGRSTLREVELETGEVLRSLNLDRELFGEGLCVHDGNLYQLTWKSRVGFIYDIETFRVLRRVHYQTEGWGLTSDGSNLLKSDGSHYIYLLEPQYFSETGRIEVYDHNGRVDNLNELELIDGVIYANIFGADDIVMIEQKTGRVVGVIDLTGILAARYHHSNLDVLNGIAYDHDNDRLFVTGKNWPRLFEIELVEK